LLYLRDRLGDDRWLDLAERAGRRLVELGQPAHDGLKWAMSPTFPRLMPNFSHGTAGVSYFLARLHEVTGEPTFLHAALQGAKYLSNVATGRREEWKIFHHEPEGEGLFYLSWCHGPAGTARFFHQLNRVTGDDEWMEWVRGGAEGIMQTGVPERRTPGFWNNVSQCCGDAGVGEFFVNLRRMTGDSRYLDFANRVTHNLRRRATETADRIGWRQAEHRVRPELLQTQTGFMQGAAGIGTYFLHLDGLEQGRDPLIRWPDSGY
jgi:lantibiotic modifying enzyme